MEEENRENTVAENYHPGVSAGRKFWLELKDIFAGTAFPFILMIVISSTIIMFASFKTDAVTSVIALVGGEIMLGAGLVIFGRANGASAYKTTVLHEQKRSVLSEGDRVLSANDEKVICRTGEYALWKSFVISFILCLPFIVFQTIELCYHNTVCTFALQYVFGWAYYPFSYLGKEYQALNYILILFPVITHTAGYYWGKVIQQKAQEKLEATNSVKGRRK